MTDVRPGIIISVGAAAATFGREISRRLAEKGPFAEFIHQIELSFDPESAAIVETPGERLSSVLYPQVDANEAKKGLGKNADAIYRLLLNHHTSILDGFEQSCLRLLDSGLNLLLPIEYLFIAPVYDAAAAWLALHMAGLVTEGLGAQRNDSFRVTGLYLLPGMTAMPKEHIQTYVFLAELDSMLDRQQAQQASCIALENVMLADLSAVLRRAAEDPETESVPENPITEGAAKLFTDIDVFRQCAHLGINVRENRVRNRAARFSAVGAHFLEYDGAQLLRVMRNSLARDLVEKIMLAAPRDKGGGF